MVKLILDERRILIKGMSLETTRKMAKATSYLVEGFMFTPAFRRRVWDGREHLMKFKKDVGHICPIGLLDDVKRCLDENGIKYKTLRKKSPPIEKFDLKWNESIKLRPYQRTAVKRFCSAPERGRGILKMPIRSGKTKTAAAIIRRIGVRTLFHVPSQMLLHQTADSLQESLPGADIGKIGDGIWEEGAHVTVATIQTVIGLRGGTKRQCPGNKLRDESGLWIKGEYTEKSARCGKKRCKGNHNFITKRDPRYNQLMKDYPFVIFDECHHLRDGIWHNAMIESQARYRLGLSATVFFDSDKEVSKGIMWLRAACGRIRYKVSMSKLIEAGYLMRQHVEMYLVTWPKSTGWDEHTQNTCIYENARRNAKIVQIVKKKLDKGLNVMIVTNRLNQINGIADLLVGEKIEHVIITGRDPMTKRQDDLYMFASGHVHVILGTVFGEGIDVPEVECIVNAQGGRDMKSTIQRMRNMTPSKGKTKCILVDFYDVMNDYLRKHSEERLATYEAEKSFRIKKLWRKKGLASGTETS